MSKIIKNKVVLYLSTRYLTYFIQFVTALVIANKLGPYYLGIWGVYLLVLNYLCNLNFGINNSLNILIVQSINNNTQKEGYIKNSFFLVFILGVLIFFIGVVYYFYNNYDSSIYNIGINIFIICLIAVLRHYNNNFGTIFRTQNKLLEMSIQQSSTQIFALIAVFIYTGERLLSVLLIAYLLGEFIPLIFFLLRKDFKFLGGLCYITQKKILQKGIWLFIYNFCFYAILLTTRSLISGNYSTEDFGRFTFSYTIASSLLLLLESFTTLIFPKLIDRYNTNNKNQVQGIADTLMNTVVTLCYAMFFCFIPLIPILLRFFPLYSDTDGVLSITSLSIIVYMNNVFIYYLMAINKERQIAIISLAALFFNIVVGLFLIKLLRVPYQYVVLSMLVSYFLFSLMGNFYAQRILGERLSFGAAFAFFPMRLFVPYCIYIINAVCSLSIYFYLIGGLLFLRLNMKQIKIIYSTLIQILSRPQIIDIRKE